MASATFLQDDRTKHSRDEGEATSWVDEFAVWTGLMKRRVVLVLFNA